MITSHQHGFNGNDFGSNNENRDSLLIIKNIQTTKAPKGPILNSHIVHEIFAKVFEKKLDKKLNNFPGGKYSLYPTIKFMLAGRETFKIALNFFSRATVIKVWNTFSELDVAFIDSCGKPNEYIISYDYPLFKLIFSILVDVARIENLEIRSAFHSASKINVFVRLFQKDIKKVTFFTNFSKIYGPLLKHSHFKFLRFIDVEKIDGLTFIPNSCVKLHISLVKYETFLARDLKNFFFPSIKILDIDCKYYNIRYYYYMSGAISIEDIQYLINFIPKCFPSLCSLNIKFSCIWNNWIEMAKFITTLEQTIMFDQISLNVKGRILFSGKYNYLSVNSKNDIQNHFGEGFDPQTKTIHKIFKIHDRLFLENYYQIS